jgi:UDP-glucose 4-epimerase
VAVVGATPAQTAREVATFSAFIDALLESPAPGLRAFFLASSAGGVYAGADDPPFTEDSPALPLNEYGRAKLRLELEARRLAETGARVLLGRISNLYGPGQKIAKQQGLITTLCYAHLTRQPAHVYVSLDTIRDYLYVDDCAALVLAGSERVGREPPGSVVTKILAAQQSSTIANLLGCCRQVFGPRVPITTALSARSRQQARDLRFRSIVWPELDRRPLTPLASGIHRTAEDLRRSMAVAV